MSGKSKSKKSTIAKNGQIKRERVDKRKPESNKLIRESVKENDNDEVRNPFGDEAANKDCVFIECPGATVYEAGTRNIIAGVEFADEQDPSKGYKIIDHPVYAPDHKKRRMIKKEHINSIRRCQACQDLTVRLIRREGVDFFIPNPRFPRKKQLKSVEKTW
jgi:hypothetical protein